MQRLLVWGLRRYVGGPARSWVFTSLAVLGFRAAKSVVGRRELVDVGDIKPGQRIVIESLPVSHKKQIRALKADDKASKKTAKASKKTAKASKKTAKAAKASDRRAAKEAKAARAADRRAATEPKVSRVTEPKVSRVTEPKVSRVTEPKVSRVTEPKVSRVRARAARRSAKAAQT